jgi:hypothetical protein
VLLEKVFDRSTFVNRGIVEDHEEQRRGKPLVELVEKGQERLGRASLGPFPISNPSKTLIHAAANFASFFVFRRLSINESTFWRMDW